MTQDNAMSVDACLQEQYDRAEQEVKTLVLDMIDLNERNKQLEERIDYLEYLLTRRNQPEEYV